MDFLIEYPYGCLEQRLSRLVPMLLWEELTKTFGFAMPKQDEWPQLIKENLWAFALPAKPGRKASVCGIERIKACRI